MFYLLAFNFAFCMIAGFFCHMLIEGPLMNLIFSSQIRARESEARLQANLKLLDHTVRIKEHELSTPGSLKGENLKSSSHSKDHFSSNFSPPQGSPEQE